MSSYCSRPVLWEWHDTGASKRQRQHVFNNYRLFGMRVVFYKRQLSINIEQTVAEKIGEFPRYVDKSTYTHSIFHLKPRYPRLRKNIPKSMQ